MAVDFTGMTAEQLRAAAKASRQSAEDSFQRCDTDGFLSQWASTLTAQLYEKQAEIVEAGGVAPFLALFDGEREVAAVAVERKNPFSFQFETQWVVDSRDPVVRKAGTKFLPYGYGEGKGRKLKALGLVEKMVPKPAKAKVVGRGRGLSGSAWVAVVPADEPD